GAARALADVDQLDAIRRGRDLAEVAQRIVVRGQVEIVAGSVSEHRFRRGHLAPRGGRQQKGNRESLQGSTASLYCSSRSSSLAVLKSFVRRSSANLRNCAM